MRLFVLLFAVGCTDPTAVVVDPDSVDPVGWSEETHTKGDADYSVLMADEGEVPRLDLVMTAANYTVLQDDLSDLLSEGGGGPGGDFSDTNPIYVPVTVAYGDQTWPQVGFRYKGNSTLYGAGQSGIEKLPFRLSMDRYEDDNPELEDQRFFGFSDLKFSSGYNDSTLQRDKLTSDTFREAGVPSAKGGFVRVYIDVGDGPEYWGLYTVFEDPAGELLDSWFGDDSGNAYKPDGDGAALENFVEADMEKKTNESEADFSDVSAFITALNADRTDAEAWRTGLDATFDTDGFLRYLALNNLIGNWDAYGRMTHNYYLYGDPADSGRLTWIPWDFNEAFDAGRGQRDAINANLSNLDSGWPLLEHLADDPVYRAAYDGYVDDYLTNVFSQAELDARIEANRARIETYVDEESAPFTARTENFTTATSSLSSFISSQRSSASN